MCIYQCSLITSKLGKNAGDDGANNGEHYLMINSETSRNDELAYAFLKDLIFNLKLFSSMLSIINKLLRSSASTEKKLYFHITLPNISNLRLFLYSIHFQQSTSSLIFNINVYYQIILFAKYHLSAIKLS